MTTPTVEFDPYDIDWLPFTFGSLAADFVAKFYVSLSQIKGKWLTPTRLELQDSMHPSLSTDGLRDLLKNGWFTETEDKHIEPTPRFFTRLYLRHGDISAKETLVWAVDVPKTTE